MKSRLFKTILTLLAPIVIEYLIKKFTSKKEVKPSNSQVPPPSQL